MAVVRTRERAPSRSADRRIVTREVLQPLTEGSLFDYSSILVRTMRTSVFNIQTVYPHTLQPATSYTPRCSTRNPGRRQARKMQGFNCTGARALSRVRSPSSAESLLFMFYFSNLPIFKQAKKWP